MNTITLTQEYFLCTIGDKGRYSAFDMEKGVCLVAAGILELMMDDILELKDKKLLVHSDLPHEKYDLKAIYDFVKKKQPVKLETVVENFSFQFTDKNINLLTESIGDTLAQMGLVNKQTKGLFGGKAVYIPDPVKRDYIIQKIRAELLENGELTDDVVALTVLLNKSRTLSQYFSAYEKDDLKRRLKEIKNSTQNQMVSKMVECIDTLFAIIIIAAT